MAGGGGGQNRLWMGPSMAPYAPRVMYSARGLPVHDEFSRGNG